MSARALAATTAGVLCLGLAACTPEPMPVPTSTPSETAAPRGDGVLTIGTLFPTTGATAFLARAQDAGVELAIREINEAGGVNGAKVVVYHRNSGDATTEKAEESLAGLVEKKVDVIIGPSSSVLAERILPKVLQAGMTMISPSATSPVLSTLPDDGRLFRTIPSSSLQGVALAELAGDGKKVALLYYSDAAGHDMHDALESALDDTGGELVVDEGFTETTNSVDRMITAVKRTEPDMVILFSPFSEMKRNKELLTKLAAAKLAGSRLWLTSQNLADYSQALPAGTLKDANGILEGIAPDKAFEKRVKSADPAVKDFHYAAEAYDATILAALAAILAKDDSGVSVADALADASSGGIKCTSFGECLDVLRTMPDIDYDGVSGPLAFDKNGDLRSAVFGLYRYGAENKYTLVGNTAAG
ncbi:ABC transporter substrate-binding protein [Leifsonia bigeumensis]|uniref:ABC transporter substrate-binding protein n=1 Tax=Leifsonella bigeumensis TaxID=433643 RepID=A0ABP7F903_9MICO